MMTVKESIELIDEVCATYRGTRQDHLRIAQAINIIRDEIQNKNPADIPQE